MTSVSLPVYDKKLRAEPVANLLGVAGTDIPVEYIQRLMLPYRLGVNGYAFIVTNNGYILIHPDLRPVYQGILKPAYNRVDVVDVEVMDDDGEPREFSDEIKELRKQIVLQMKGNVTLKVKTHLDDMRRLFTSSRHYFYMGINDTPFSLVIALPHKYGFVRVQHPVENDIHRIRSNDKIKGSLTQFFTGNWTIHPDWHYCRYLGEKQYFEYPNDEFIHFLRKMEGPGWKWGNECDRKLICKVVADAKITSWFSQNITTTTKEENGAELIKKFGVTVAFMATHSGLTRWQDFPQNFDLNLKDELHFSILHNKAIDEIWYRRAVEYHYIDPMTFVYSVPADIGDENNTMVTVSHAIFREEKKEKAPAAVIGYQFYHSALYSQFTQITTACPTKECKRTCSSSEIDCLLLDDNGYVIISENLAETGYFFGRIRPNIMSQMVEEGIYRTTRMYDYQGLCPVEREPSGGGGGSPASKSFYTPFNNLMTIAKWAALTLNTFTDSVWGDSDYNSYSDQEGQQRDYDDNSDQDSDNMDGNADQSFSKFNEKEFDSRLLIKKTKPEPCDNEMWLYNLVHYTERNISASGYNKTMIDCTRPFIVQKVSSSNMILLVIHNLCPEVKARVYQTPDPQKIDYNMSLTCYRAQHNDFTRRNYMSCINNNANESMIKLCGRASLRSSSGHFLVLISLVRLIAQWLSF